MSVNIINITKIIEKAREYLENVTPVKSDCGLMCGSLCCKKPDYDNNGNTGMKGMWLFPGESELYINNKNFDIIHADGNESYPFLLCKYSCENGDFCKRNERPLFCRLFPYFPLVSEIKRRGETRYRIKLIIHPAAVTICPVINFKLKITSDFSRAVRKAVYVMLNQKSDGGEELKSYIIKTGEYLNMMTEFVNRVYIK